MTEKAVSIASWSLALGISTHINPVLPITGSKALTNLFTKGMEKIIGGKVLIGTTPESAAKIIINEIMKKRRNLNFK